MEETGTEERKVYVIKIRGEGEDKKRILNTIRQYTQEHFPNQVDYVVLPDDLKTVEFYFKERLLDILENIGKEAVKATTREFVQGMLEHIFSSEEKKE